MIQCPFCGEYAGTWHDCEIAGMVLYIDFVRAAIKQYSDNPGNSHSEIEELERIYRLKQEQ